METLPTEAARMKVALVRFDGAPIFALPLKQMPDGTWLMKSQSHQPRFTIGDNIIVAPDELMGITGEELAAQAAAPPIIESQNIGDLMAEMKEIDGLVSLTQTIASIKALASDAAKKFKGSVANLNDAVTTTHTVSESLDKAALDIRSALGVQSNAGPPLDPPTT